MRRQSPTNLAAGDRIVDIVGFSRGAALALAFANRLSNRVTDPATGKAPRIRFLGVWDVVGAFGDNRQGLQQPAKQLHR